MSSITRTPTAPSTALRDARHQAAVALLRRAGEQAALIRHSCAAFMDETADDAVVNRALVAADANASAWRHGQAWRPEDNYGNWTPECRRRQAKALARNLARRSKVAAR
jgi:hypothetical protein